MAQAQSDIITGDKFNPAEQIRNLQTNTTLDQQILASAMNSAIGQSIVAGIYYEAIPPTKDYAGIMSAIAQIVANGGVGAVRYQAGTYNIGTNYIPLQAGISHIGVQPEVTAPIGQIPDQLWTVTGGTIISGTGQYGMWDGRVAQGATSPNYPQDSLIGCNLKQLAFTGFSVAAVQSGATNVLGHIFCDVENLYAWGCSGKSFNFVNFMHVNFKTLHAPSCPGGMWFTADIPSGTLIPGNSQALDIFNASSSNRLARGIVLQATSGSILNTTNFRHVQNNHFSRSQLVAATSSMSNGSPNITVTGNGANFPVGMPVTVGSSVNGFTQNQTYFVVSQVADVVQISNTYGGAALNSNNNTAMNLITNGFPCLEMTGAGIVANSYMTAVDVEGSGTAAIVMQNCQTCGIDISAITVGTTWIAHLVGRNATYSRFNCLDIQFKWDLDANSSGMQIDTDAPISQAIQRVGQGRFAGTVSLNGSAVAATPPRYAFNFDLSAGGIGFTKVGAALGQRIAPKDASETVNTFEAGVIPCKVAAQTFTLPTITDAWVGMPWEFVNASGGNMTIATDGTQVFNGQAGKITTTVGAGLTVKCRAIKYVDGTFGVQAFVGGALP